MVSKAEAKGGATNVNDGDTNPNGLVKFVDFKAPRVTVYTTDKVIKHYPVAGTPVALQPDKAAKWIEKGYATAEAQTETSKTKAK